MRVHDKAYGGLVCAIAAAQRHASRLLVMLVAVNLRPQAAHGGTVGQDFHRRAGQQLAAQRLQGAVRCSDTVYRLDGEARVDEVSGHQEDDYMVLLAEISHPADAVLIAANVMVSLSAPALMDGQLSHLGASLGLAIYPDDGLDALALFDKAATALYGAKFQAAAEGGDRASDPDPAGRDARLWANRALRHAHRLRDANEQLLIGSLAARRLHDQRATASAPGGQCRSDASLQPCSPTTA